MAFKDSDFTSEIQWEQEAKLCKLEFKTSQKGTQYFYGELNKLFKVVMRPDKFNEGKWVLSLVPVKFKKVEAAQPAQVSKPVPVQPTQSFNTQTANEDKAPWEE